MKTNNSKKTTGSTPQISPETWYNKFLNKLTIWWPIPLVLTFFIIAGITKYFYGQTYNENSVYSLMVDLLRALGVFMIVLYVIYTRLLSLETKKMSEATIGLLKEQKGTVLAELFECDCNIKDLMDDVKDVSEILHIKDKGFKKEEFEKLIREESLHAVALILKNMSGRRIEGTRVEYRVRHTGTDEAHDMILDIRKIGTIEPWKDKSIILIAAPEGDIEVITKTFDYIDVSGSVQRVDVAKKIRLSRIRKPEVGEK